MSHFSTPSAWRVEDLSVGQIIYCPPNKEVDPVTRKAGSDFQKFQVVGIVDGVAQLMPYRGPLPADMPPASA